MGKNDNLHPGQRMFGEFYSWNVLPNDVAIKRGDKSFFEQHGSAIPKQIKWFFSCEDLQTRQKKAVIFIYQAKQYQGHIECDTLDRCRIFWDKELNKEFQAYYHPENKEFPLIRFQKISQDCYGIDFIDGVLISSEKTDPLETVVIPQKEGKKKEFYVSKYERNPENRLSAIKIHGTKCMICGFDFEAFYGEAGRNFIEVHHIKPLSDIGEEVTVDPEKDLVCVCSNCHRIIHRKKDGVYSIEEVRGMIKK